MKILVTALFALSAFVATATFADARDDHHHYRHHWDHHHYHHHYSHHRHYQHFSHN